MIKNDRWIIQKSKEMGMIDPFEPKQITEVRTPSGMKKVISYGTSSMAMTSARRQYVSDSGSDAAAKQRHQRSQRF